VEEILMKRHFLCFVIAFMGFSLSLFAKQKLICYPQTDPTLYKTDTFNGKYVTYPLNDPDYPCPDSITVKNKYSQDIVLELFPKSSNSRYCYYGLVEAAGPDNDLRCIFTQVTRR
jgi:hypothetical protein